MAKDPIEILRQRDAEVAKIRGFVDLTDEAKDRRIADVNGRARAEYAEAREAAARERAERLESTQRAVFRVPVPAIATDAEAAQIRASYRARPTTTSTPPPAAPIARDRPRRSSSGSWSRPSARATGCWRARLTTGA